MAQTLNRGPVSGTAATPPSKKKKKPFLVDFYSTAVGKKYVMAITGIIGIGFVVVHMIGNLKMYLGVVEENGELIYDIDVYGEFLRDLRRLHDQPHLADIGGWQGIGHDYRHRRHDHEDRQEIGQAPQEDGHVVTQFAH